MRDPSDLRAEPNPGDYLGDAVIPRMRAAAALWEALARLDFSDRPAEGKLMIARRASICATAFGALIVTTSLSRPVAAHCDTLDGPVVVLAQKALETGNVNLVLPWVREDDEPQIRRTFEHALSVRKLGAQAKQLADEFFFETLVRVHRASEGAPYSGLKPAGLDLGPAIPAADKALETGSTKAIEKMLEGAIRKGLHDHFQAASNRAKFDPDDVPAGREYVRAYVPYIHYVEALWEAATGSAEGHYTEPSTHAH
jgi:hypothetical protein